ncbi:MAG: hypothetical protein QXP70_02005 [Methanomassiliicoccales archaeon]
MYKKQLISPDEREELLDKHGQNLSYGIKANISGVCIKLNTDIDFWAEEWRRNWFPMLHTIHSHGRLFVKNIGGEEVVKYDPLSNTAFLFDTDYYGYVKSIALAIAGDVMEENHDIYSIHGACLDIDGKGVSIIAPSGTGKTTTAYGLMRLRNVRFIGDDWHFFRFFGEDVIAYGSENESYIRADVGDVWHEYEELVKIARFDNKNRAVVDISRIVGRGNIRDSVPLKHVILLKRDPADKTPLRKLETDEAIDFLVKHEFCNPHFLVEDERKNKLRKKAYTRLLKATDVYMLNTTETPMQSHMRIREALGIPEDAPLRKIGGGMDGNQK